MNLEFNIEEMNNLYSEAMSYTQQFKSNIENLDYTINELGKYWVSDETNTYQEFLNLYNLKKKNLEAAYEGMLKFCKKIEEKRFEFIETSNKVKNNFE